MSKKREPFRTPSEEELRDLFREVREVGYAGLDARGKEVMDWFER